MRLTGTKYEVIDKLPDNAMPVSTFASANNTAVGYVYVKYERFMNGKGAKPNYSIRCFQGSNFIIPE